MQIFKEQITKIVRDYMRTFPAEYNAFRNSVRIKKEGQSNKFGLAKETQIELRALYDIPETLDVSMSMLLSEEALQWLRSKEGARWFARKFPAFKVAQEI